MFLSDGRAKRKWRPVAPGTPSERKSLRPLHRNSRTFASLRLARAASHLQRAGQQLAAAKNGAVDRHNRDKLYRLERDIRELSQPIAQMMAALERGGGR